MRRVFSTSCKHSLSVERGRFGSGEDTPPFGLLLDTWRIGHSTSSLLPSLMLLKKPFFSRGLETGCELGCEVARSGRLDIVLGMVKSLQRVVVRGVSCLSARRPCSVMATVATEVVVKLGAGGRWSFLLSYLLPGTSTTQRHKLVPSPLLRSR